MMQDKPVKSHFSLGEEIAHSISHGVMAIFSLIATLFMLLRSDGDGMRIVSSLFFGLSMVLLYTMSCLYHAFIKRAKRVFERMDHLAIYILIGGTFVPFLLVVIGGTLGWVLFIVQWSLIIVGVVFKSIWVKKYVKLHVLLFLLMGWSAIFFIRPLYVYSPEAFFWVLAGGVSYSVGTLFFVNDWFKYHHFVWHIFVLLGSIFHFVAIYGYIL